MSHMGSSTAPSHNAPPSPKRLDEYIASPKRAVWSMALPMMAGMAVHTLYVIVDTAFIGSLGTEALAALTFVAPLFFIMVTLTMGMGTAVTALVAQAVGRREAGGADHVAGNALSVGVVLGLALTAIGLILGPPMISLLGAESQTAELGWEYFQIITFLVPLFFISTTLRSVLTGEGDARTPTIVMAISTVINLGLDAAFIFGLGLGIRGAALATAVAQLFSLTAFWFLVFRRKTAFVRFRPSLLIPSGSVMWKLAALGVPTSAGMMVMSVGAIAMNRVIKEFGDVAVASYGAANKVDMIVGMPIFGLAGATVAIIGMFAGAGRVDLVRSTALYAYRWALILAVSIGATAYVASDLILMIFVRENDALTIGRTYLGFMIFAYPTMAIGMTTGRLLQGLGHGIPSLIITAVRVLAIAVPAAYIAVYWLSLPLEAVWSSMLLSGVCASVIAIIWVRQLIWKQDPTQRAIDDIQTSEAASENPSEPAPAPEPLG